MLDTYVKLVNDGGHNVQNFSFPRVRDISVVVDEDSLEERRNHVGVNHFKIIRFFDICIDELQDLFFDGSKSTDFRCFGGNMSFACQCY